MIKIIKPQNLREYPTYQVDTEQELNELCQYAPVSSLICYNRLVYEINPLREPCLYTRFGKAFALIYNELTAIDVSRFTPNYLCFTALEANSSVKLILTKESAAVPIPAISLEYSYDKKNWNTFIAGTDTIELDSAGSKVYFRGDNETFAINSGFYTNYYHFDFEGMIAASGSIMSIFDSYDLSREFKRDRNCLHLFESCTELIEAPELPATKLTTMCYGAMFKGCSNLIKAPELPAAVLADRCYLTMFFSCTNLTTVPELPAIELVNGCYSYMFSGCSNLEGLEVKFINFDPETLVKPTGGWLSGASETATFKCPVKLNISSRSDDTVPENWTIITY